MVEVRVSIENLQEETKPVEKEADQASGGSNQAVNASNEGEHVRDLWVKSMCASAKKWMEKREEEMYKSKTPEPRIHKLPAKFPCKEGNDYTPRVVSIGPYHSDNSKLQKMNKTKAIMAGLLCYNQCEVNPGSEELPKAEFFDQFAAKIKNLRNQYECVEDIDEEKFVQMMFLDGCFIIVFMSYFVDSALEEFEMTKDVIASVQHDIFLLENQIPFEVLEALCNEKFNRDELLVILDRYFRYCTIGYNRYFQQEIGFKDTDELRPLHLLDLLRITWLGKAKFYEFVGQKQIKKQVRKSGGYCVPRVVPPILSRSSASPFSSFKKVGDLFMKGHWSALLKKNSHLFMKGRVIRNMKELTATGIYLKPNTSNLFSDIHFSNILTGRLTLPRIIIDGSTRTIFLNMIAHEYCMNDHFGFTSYISFLDSLIDTAEDVKLMRSAGVLEHFLDSDEEVANLFNEIGADLVPQVDIYKSVKIKIYSYLESKCRATVATWLAEVIRVHFRSPWTTIAIFAAFFAIALTAVQTYFAIFPRSNH